MLATALMCGFLFLEVAMDEKLVKEAQALGINASLYYLLPPQRREAALRADIAREKARKEEAK